jgi:cleavage and polyadenylation specificity factor subunit 6/7
VSEAEFEEILQRNKTVSSSAISRAVQDASAGNCLMIMFYKCADCSSPGDYASAIETLVTAISLIKQSKIANDDRCKILISSLQDTLHGIESKSYGSR